MKINNKYAGLLFAFLMSLFMALLMSGVLTAIHLGFKSDFIVRWLAAFAIAWPIAFPSIFVIAPTVRKIVGKLTDQSDAEKAMNRAYGTTTWYILACIVAVRRSK